MRFQDRAKDHLGKYRSADLKIVECGLWRGMPYQHILPLDRLRENILPTVRDSFWKWVAQRRIKLHKDFAHLNSSQAFCFNLFFPLTQSENGLQNLLSALNIKGSAIQNAQFEYIPEPGEGTSFDFLLPLVSGARILFEVKYTESDFGSAAPDAEHQGKYAELYRPRCGSRFTAAYEGAEAFLRHYQILRNVWHLRETQGDTVIFLVPQCNELLARKLYVIRDCVHEVLRDRVKVVFVEDLLNELRRLDSLDPETRQCLEDFQRKYLPASVTKC